MKQPYFHYREPRIEDYAEKTETVRLCQYFEKFVDDDANPCCQYCDEELGYCDREWIPCDCEWSKEAGEDDAEKPLVRNLQAVLDMLPAGVEPKDVFFTLGIDIGSMAINGCDLIFFYSKTLKENPEGFEVEKRRYQEALKKHEEELEKYNEWKKIEDVKNREKEIEELEKKLTDLKNSK
jgi:hypothetical protein